jgi:4-hydroxy-tetrahydrodipicolinate reductase
MGVINVAVAGCFGKMGAAVCETVIAAPDMKLCALADAKAAGRPEAYGLSVCGAISRRNSGGAVDVMVEFTHPSCVYDNVMRALEDNINCVVGTTGLSESQRGDIEKLTLKNNLFTLIAPNFAIGAVLMMKFSEAASRYMGRAEIIEMHHDQKADAPSGTSLLTAKMMAPNCSRDGAADEKILLSGARGAALESVNIHSVRLPGFLAHQQVIFGGPGQVLTIRHDSMSRDSFMPGVALAVRESQKRKGFYFGLENIMELTF